MSEDKNRKKSIFRRIKRDNVTDMPSNPTTRKELGYSAYTTPADNDLSAYSPQTPSNNLPPFEDEEKPQKPKKTGFAKFFAVGIISFAVIVVASFATYLFTHYDFQLSSGNGVIKFSLLPKLSKSPNPQGQQQGQPQNQQGQQNPQNQQQNPSASSPDNNPGSGVPSGQIPPAWDGTMMTVGTPANSALSLQQIYKKCAPSVVAIHCESLDASQNGAGIVISVNGYIVTNQHVTYGANSIAVTLQNGGKYSAELIGEDDQTDISVIKIDASGLIPAEFSDFQSLEVGDRVVTIGNVLNQTLSMADGIITAINRNLSFNGFPTTLLQTSATINSGNSGGPLISMSGQVVGITNAALVPSTTAVKGIGFAVPSVTVKPIIDALMKDGYVKGRPSLGVRLSDIAVSAYAYYKLPKGVYVNRVYMNSDAYAEGIQPGDVICAINSTAVSSLNDLTAVINTFAVGDSVKVKLYRNGNYLTPDVKLMDKADLK